MIRRYDYWMYPSEERPNTDLPQMTTQYRWIDTDWVPENSSNVPLVLALADVHRWRDLQIASWADLRQHHTAAAAKTYLCGSRQDSLAARSPLCARIFSVSLLAAAVTFDCFRLLLFAFRIRPAVLRTVRTSFRFYVRTNTGPADPAMQSASFSLQRVSRVSDGTDAACIMYSYYVKSRT